MTTLPATDKRYTAIVVLGQEYWEIRFSVGDYETECEAKYAVDTSTAIFLKSVEKQCACIAVCGFSFELMLTDNDVQIREITPEAVARLGSPLDMTIAENRTTAIEALQSNNPAYIIEDADFAPSGLTLADFMTRYGAGYEPDCIAYEIEVKNSVPLSEQRSSSVLFDCRHDPRRLRRSWYAAMRYLRHSASKIDTDPFVISKRYEMVGSLREALRTQRGTSRAAAE